MTELSADNAPLRHHFEMSSSETKAERPQKSKTSPFSLRLTNEERAWLDQQAGYRPLGDYIRAKILGENAQKRRTLRKTNTDAQQIALVLSMLGDSRLASNLNQLAKHANMGTLDVSEHVEEELTQACAAIVAMRDTLLIALGHKPISQPEDKGT